MILSLGRHSRAAGVSRLAPWAQHLSLVRQIAPIAQPVCVCRPGLSVARIGLSFPNRCRKGAKTQSIDLGFCRRVIVKKQRTFMKIARMGMPNPS